MEEEYDYSMYTTVCTINMCFVRQSLTIRRASIRAANASTRYVPVDYLEIPLGFYYNKEDGDIIYGSLMRLHYKQYPPQKRYIHVPNFLQEFHALYQGGCDKDELQMQRNTALYLATKAFLTKIYPSQLLEENDTSSIQYVFILPTQAYARKEFVEAFWHPLLQDTPWASKSNLSSKIKFYNKYQCLTYYLNKQIVLQREHLYLLWNLQRSSDGSKLLVDVAPMRAVYDPDLISASNRSTATLGGNILYSPKLPFSATSFEVSVPSANEKMDELANFLYEKVFALQETASHQTQLDEYKADSKDKSVIHQLISAISESIYKDQWDAVIEVDHFMNSYQMSNLLTEESKSRLSLITYGDVLQLFDDSNAFSWIKDKVLSAIQIHSNEQNFHNLVVMEEDGWVLLRHEKENLYGHCDYNFASEHCHKFYSMKAQRTIFDIVKESSRSKSSTALSFEEQNLTDGCAYKSLKMIELSSKTKRPIVVESKDDDNNYRCDDLLKRPKKFDVINQLQPYGYYVEANIQVCGRITLSLNQVIETADGVNGMRKSTLSILDVCCEATDMYEFVSDYIWETVAENMAEQASNSTEQADMVMIVDNYKAFTTNLSEAMRKYMENASINITDLDDIIYNHQPHSICSISISHRFLMDVGLTSYLKYMASVIVSSLKADVILGKHKISCLVATGEQLYVWANQYNSTYGNFLWDHLESEIAIALHSKNLGVHLVMKRSAVFEDSICNYEPLKLELYRQVFSKHYYVIISFAQRLEARIHQDKGNHHITIPCTTTEEGSSIWRIPVSHTTDEGALRSVLKERFYVNFDLQQINQAYCSLRLVCLSNEELANLDEAVVSNFNVALLVGRNPFAGPSLIVKNRISFPLELDIRPCSHMSAVTLKMRMGIDVTLQNPLSFDENAFPERLTLQAL